MKGTFLAKVVGKTGEISLYDEIGSRGITQKAVKESLDKLKASGANKLDVYIDSPGGDVFQGMAIFNMIDRFSAEKNIFVDGIAASIASVIAMSGSKRVMGSGTSMMIHKPYGGAYGESDDLRKTADAMDKVFDSIVDIYASKTKQPASDIASWMKETTWMKAQECVDRGFADSLSNDTRTLNEGPCRFSLLAKFKNTPREILGDVAESNLMLARMRMSKHLPRQVAGNA